MSIHTTRANLLAQPVKVVLERYNDLATDLGKPTLKAWKAPAAGLVERILKMMQEAGDRVEVDTPAAEATKPVAPKMPHPAIKSITSTDHKTTRIKADDKPATKKAAKPKLAKNADKPAKKAKAAPTGDTFTLADLARDLKINPKVARAKARRHKIKADADGWTFKAARLAEVTAILKGDA